MLSPLRLVLTGLLIGGLLLLAFWCVCLAMHFSRWRQDTQPLVDLFHAALGAMSEGAAFAHMAGLAERSTVFFHHTLFVTTGLEAALHAPTKALGAEAVQHAPAGVTSALGHAMEKAIGQIAPTYQVVVVATQVFALRLALLAGMLPLVAVGFMVAHADGGAERAIRRASVGRESANLYHQAKSLQFALIGLVLMITLCMPIHVNPLLTMAGFLVCLVPLAWVQGTYYKKYR